MFGFFVAFLIFKGIMLALFSVICGMSTGLLVCCVFGVLFEGIAAHLLADSDATFIRELLYYAGVLMQIIPYIIMSVPFFTASDNDMNFLKAIAIGWGCLIIAVGWFANGFDGSGSFAYYYGASLGALAVEGILYAIMSMHALLIVNTVVAALAVVVIIICRFAIGSNME